MAIMVGIVISRRSLLLGAGAAALAPIASKAAQLSSNGRKLRFVVLSDIHMTAGQRAPQAVEKCVRRILKLSPRPHFILTGGDHVFDATAQTLGETESQFKLLDEALKPLELPIYHTIGNHDVYGWNPRSDASAADPKYGKRLFEEKVAESRTYRSIDVHGWHIIILDDIYPTRNRDWIARIDAEQLEWLRNDLRATGKQTPILISVHVPLFTIFHQYNLGAAGSEPKKMICQNGRDVYRLFEGYNVRVVLQGHTHVLEECRYLNTRYITAGSVCGEWWKGPRLGVHREGFSVVDLHPDHAEFTYMPYGWNAATTTASLAAHEAH